VPSVLHSVKMFVTESRTLPSAALDKAFFTECPRKGTRQSVWHSAKARIPVVMVTLPTNKRIVSLYSKIVANYKRRLNDYMIQI
jgi:hypothetical protein